MSTSRFKKFRSDIRKLIGEIERHMHRLPADADREYQLQRAAFEERAGRAQQLADEIAVDEQTLWSLRDGDAQRAEDSLRLSLNYFRPDA